MLLHRFPDNSHIYDDLILYLIDAGRRTIAFDFLGFGDSDKLEDTVYSFQQQLGDVEAVFEALGLEKIVPVGHDAGGPAAVNYVILHPERVVSVCIMNAFYAQAPGLRVPEFIELFATKSLRALTSHLIQSLQQFDWPLNFQRGQIQKRMSESQKAHYNDFLGPIIKVTKVEPIVFKRPWSSVFRVAPKSTSVFELPHMIRRLSIMCTRAPWMTARDAEQPKAAGQLELRRVS